MSRRNKWPISRHRPAFIYAIGYKDDRYPIKVGITTHPESRIPSLQTGCWHPLFVRYQRKCKNRDAAIKCEKMFQQKFDHARVMGEWFELSLAEIISGIDDCLGEGA